MRRRLSLAVVLCAALPALAATPAPAAPLPGEVPCPDDAGLRCATVTVPLDRSGVMPGTIGLAVRRLPATSGSATGAIVVLAGGPGQAATPLARDLADVLGGALAARDLLLFDARGTGGSGALRCAALRGATTIRSPGRCAAQLGARRAFYTTEATVEDLDAVRAAAGLSRLDVMGVSYGTKVALRYAARHGDRVSRLVLDSTLAPDGPDPFTLSTFAAMRRVLPALCADGRCAGTTSHPTADVAALRRRLARGDLRTSVRDGRGRRVRVRVSVLDLLSILRSGDLNPSQRAELPGAVRAALRHDGAPLARLALRAAISGGGSVAAASGDGVDDAAFLTTTCEESALPWERDASPLVRLEQAAQRAGALPVSAVSPFDRAAAFAGGLVPLCLTWPDASPPPPALGTPADVPALLLEGADDLRTPVEDARRTAALLPRARLLVVPHTGHSVLGSDLSDCSHAALAAFLSDAPVSDCTATRDAFPPTRTPPRSVAGLRPTGAAGAAGRTARALLLTLADARRALISDALARERLPRPGTRIGGLRAGSLRVTTGGIRLAGYAFVPGVTVSGLVPNPVGATAYLRVGGAAAAHGTVALHAGALRGRLGGRRVRIAAASAASASLQPHRLLSRTPRLARVR